MSLSIQAKPCFSGAVRQAARRGFTLIEVMIVVSIIAIIIAAGVPSIFRAMEKNELARSAQAIVEGCSHARGQAILTGRIVALVVRAEDGAISVVPAADRSHGSDRSAYRSSTAQAAISPFSAKLGENVMVRLLDVNFVDHMPLPEARPRFFPNGTSDEFTIVIESGDGQRKISLDMVTGLAHMDVTR